MIDAQGSTSTRPYLIRALYEWCADNGLTPYLAVQVDDTVQVPREYVKDGEIVLNVSVDATSGLHIGNDIVSWFRSTGSSRSTRARMGKGWLFLAPLLRQPSQCQLAALRYLQA